MEPTQTPPSKLRAAYDYLKKQDVTVPENYDEFEQGMQDPERLKKLYGYFKEQDVTVPDNYDEFSQALLADVKKKPGGVDAGNGSLPAPTAQPPANGLGEPDQEFRQQPQVGPLGYALPGDPTAPQTLAPDFTGPVPAGTYVKPSDKGTAAEGTQYVDAPAAPVPAPAEAPDVADDGFFASFGKAFHNGIDPRRIAGNLVDYFGDAFEMLSNAQLYDESGARIRPTSELGQPITDSKPTDRMGADLLAQAQASDLPLSQSAQQDGFSSLAGTGNLLGGGVASIIPVAAASALGGPLAGAAVGGGLGISSTKDAARAAGISDEEATVMATVLAPIQAALEAVGVKDPGVSKLAVRATLREALAAGGGRLTAQALAAATKRVVPELGRRAVAGASHEALTEFLQGVAEGEAKVAADALRGNEQAPAGQGRYGTTQGEVFKSAAEQAAVGAFLGGGLGTTHGGEQVAQAPAAPTVDVVRPSGQVELRGAEIVGQYDPNSATVTVRAPDAQGNWQQMEVRKDWLRPVAGAPEAAQSSTAENAPTEPVGNGSVSTTTQNAAEAAPAQNTPTSLVSPQPSAAATAETPASPPNAAGGEATAANETEPVDVTGQSEPIPTELLPAAEPHPDHVTPLTKEQAAKNEALDALDRFNALNKTEQKSDNGKARRKELIKAASKAGLKIKDLPTGKAAIDGPRVTRSNEYTATTPAANHVPLDARPEGAHAFMEAMLFTGDAANVKELQGLGIKMRGKELSARELADAVKDIRAGRNTLRAQLVLDTLENAHRQGFVEKSTGTGLATQKFRVPVDEYLGQPESPAGEPRDLTDDELDAIYESDPKAKEAVDNYAFSDGTLDYERLARDERGLSFMFDVSDETATKLATLARERAQQQSENAQRPIPRPSSDNQGAEIPDTASREAGTDAGSTPQSDARVDEPTPASEPEVEPVSDANVGDIATGPNEAKKAEIRAEIDAASQRIKERRAARKKEGKVFSAPIGEIDVEDLKDALTIAKGHVQLGVLGIKNLIAEVRKAGLSEEDASDEALTPHFREMLTGEPAPTLPPNEPDGSATRSSMERLLADPTAPGALKQRVRDTGLDKYKPVSIADTEKAVDAYMQRNSLADAYAEAISTTDNLTGDVRTALRVRVLKVVGEQLSQAVSRGDTASADEYLGQAEKVTEALAKRGTDAGREINAYKLLVVHSPEAAVYKAQKEVAAQRVEAEKKLGTKANKEGRAVRKAKADALDNALATPAVRAAREKVASPSPAKPGAADAPKYGETNRFFTKEGLTDLRQRLKSMAFSAPLPPDLVYLGAYHIEAGARKFADFSAKMVREVGARVRPRLPELYELSKQEFVGKGGIAADLEGADAVEGALRKELADNLADRIVGAVTPTKPGVFDPVKQMLDTLTKQVGESLPNKAAKPKSAREALAHALNNRREYQKVLAESRQQVLEKIASLKVSDEAKQQMVDSLTDFIDQVNDKPYGQQQLNRAIRQAEDAILPSLGGKNRADQYERLANLSEDEYLKVLPKIQDHVTAGVAATDTEAKDLRDAVAEEVNKRVLAKRRAIRAKNGVFEEGQKPAPKVAPSKPTATERAATLLAARATPQQIAERLSPEAVRDGVKDLGTTLDQIARDHLSDPAAIGKTLAEQFVTQTGISDADAKIYADAIEQEFSKRITQARQRRIAELDRRAQATPTKRSSPTDLQATQELFTLSPTDDNAILDHLKRVNDLPELTVQDVADLRALAEKVRAAPEGFQQEEAVEALMKRQQKIKGLKLADIGSAIWYANVLSGYKTHVVNLTANVIQSGAELGVSTVHAVGSGKGRFSTASAKGLARGLARGAREAYSVLTTGRETSRTPGKYEVPSLLENIRFAGGAANPYNYLKLVGRGLRAGDVLFASGLKEMRAYELAVKTALEDAKGNGTPTAQVWADVNERLYTTSQRISEAQAQATAEGLKGNDYQRRVYEIAEQSRGVEMMDEAREYGTRAVFNGDVKGAFGWVATGIQQITNGISYKGFQPAKYIVPFTRVITNVANAYLDYTPIGAARAIKGGHVFGGDAESSMQRQFSTEERQKLAIKAVVGASVSAGMYALSHMKDDDDNPLLEISGAGTGNYLKDAQLKADGWQPYSIRVPGTKTWATYAYTPIGAMLAVVGNLNDGEKYRGELLGDDDKPLSALYVNSMRAMQFTKDMTALKGAADFLRVLDTKNPTELSSWAERVGSGSIKGYLPWSGFLTQTAKDAEALAGMSKKQGRSFGQMLYQDIPVARSGVNDALDALGDPLPIDTDRLFSAPPHRDEPTQRIWNWMNKHDLFISVPSRNSGGAMLLKMHEGKEGPMSDDEYYAFMKKRGELLKSAIQDNITRLEKMPPDKAKKWLREHATKANTKAKRAIFGPSAVPIGDRATANNEED